MKKTIYWIARKLIKIRNAIYSLVWGFINLSWLFLAVIAALLVVSPFILHFNCFVDISNSSRISFDVFMGDSPHDAVGEFVVPLWVIVYLYVLRFFGWLMLPVIVSVVLEKGRAEITRKQEEPYYSEKTQNNMIDALIGEGFSEEEARAFVEALNNSIKDKKN